MTTNGFERSRRLFQRVLELPEPERAELLAVECANDPKMRAEVESLLHAYDASSSGATARRRYAMTENPSPDPSKARELFDRAQDRSPEPAESTMHALSRRSSMQQLNASIRYFINTRLDWRIPASTS